MEHRKIKYLDRACCNCGAHEWEALYFKRETIQTKNTEFEFEIQDCICLECGLVQMNPVPLQKDLNDYYKSKYLHFSGKPDFHMDNRLQFLRENAGSRKTLLEYGSNEGSFLDAAKRMGFIPTGDELNDAAGTSAAGQEGPFDIAIANHVLEHVAEPLAFLTSVRSLLSANGMLIIEVPNLYAYNLFATAISHEHLFHFAPYKLARFMTRAGFADIWFDFSLVSRPLGMTVVGYKRDDLPQTSNSATIEFNDSQLARSFYLAAVHHIKVKEREIEAFLPTLLLESSGIVVLWGVNVYLFRLLKAAPSIDLARLFVVDASADKWGKNVSDEYPIPIHSPPELTQHRIQISCVAICATSYEADIRQMILRLGITEARVCTVPY